LGETHRKTDGQTDVRTDRQTGDFISLTFVFKESRLKIKQQYYALYRRLFEYPTTVRLHKLADGIQLYVLLSEWISRSHAQTSLLITTTETLAKLGII
jgi:hypothetical protein